MEGNKMKMRDTLDRIFSRFSVDGLGRHWIRLNEYDWQLIKSALSAPARQCDVGTPDEQAERWQDYCDDVTRGDCPPSSGCKSCALYWAQTPYAEEGAGK